MSKKEAAQSHGGKGRTSSRKNWSAWQDVVPTSIRWTCMAWEILKYVFQFYLCTRQYRVIDEKKKIPKVLFGKLPPETFEKAREYNKELLVLEMISCFYFIIYDTWAVLYAGNTAVWFISGPVMEYLGFWPQDWDQEAGESIVFIVLNILIANGVVMPLELWRNFVIEERYNFNRMSVFQYVRNWVKIVFIESVWSVLIGLGIIWIVRETGKNFFVYVWLFCFMWLLFTLAVYPNLLAPVFNKYTPLREGRLRERLHRLAHFLGFPLDDVLVLHQSWKSDHRDAYFIGLLSSKRIILFDTILEGYPEADMQETPKRRVRKKMPDEEDISLTSVPSRIAGVRGTAETSSGTSLRPKKSNEGQGQGQTVSRSSMYDRGFTEYEIEAIVARLMGHWVMGHAVREMIFPEISLFLFFFIFSYLYENSSLFGAFAVPQHMDKPILLGLRLLYLDVLDIYRLFVDEVMQHLSRQREYESDSFATRLGYGEDLINAIIELNKENLGYPYYDKWYWNFHYSIPSMLQRIEEIEEEMKRMSWKRE